MVYYTGVFMYIQQITKYFISFKWYIIQGYCMYIQKITKYRFCVVGERVKCWVIAFLLATFGWISQSFHCWCWQCGLKADATDSYLLTRQRRVVDGQEYDDEKSHQRTRGDEPGSWKVFQNSLLYFCNKLFCNKQP